MKDSFEEKIFRMAEQEKMVLPESIDERVTDTLVSLPERKKIFRMTWKKSIILAAAFVMMLSVTVSAAVGALRERMEAMNRQEMEDYFAQVYANKIGTDNSNRPFTNAEKERMTELSVSYEEESLFPSGTLDMISEAGEYKGKGVAFLGDTATFFLPEKELSDEELLQIIDFRHKRDYALQKMNESMTEDERAAVLEKVKEEKEEERELTDSVILNSDAVWEPTQELTIPYTGELELRGMAAGQNCIFLMGWNAIHVMEIGSSESSLFFDDFDVKTDITSLYQDKKGDIYLGLLEIDESDDYNLTMAGEKYKRALWILSAEGEIKKKIDISAYCTDMGPVGMGAIKRMVVDEQGYIYIRVIKEDNPDTIMIVLDQDGNYIKDITRNLESPYYPHLLAGLGIGKDGKVYAEVESGPISEHHKGIASVNLEKGCLEDVYMDIVPGDTIMLDIISPGTDTDFVFWGYDGIFTYNLGDESAVNVLPSYEAPCEWEGVLYCALPDGRIVFASCTEYRVENEMAAYRIPEKTCFYYKSSVQ